MKLPVGKISGKQIEVLFQEAIKSNINEYYKILAEYEPMHLYSHWRSIVRLLDETINIPLELDSQEDVDAFLGLNFNLFEKSNMIKLKEITNLLRQKFEKNIDIRFEQLAMMSSAINFSFKSMGFFQAQGSSIDLSSVPNAILYYQSRRAYFVATLNLIPKVSKGRKIINFIDTLNFLLYPLDGCLTGVTTAYYNLLINQCLPDFEMISDGKIIKGNFDYEHLEGFFVNPQRLSLIDQMELRQESVKPSNLLTKASEKLFSFSEVRNVLILFGAAYGRYEIEDTLEYKELNGLVDELSKFVQNDFHVVVEEKLFDHIIARYKNLPIYNASSDYFEILNSYSPFQKVDKKYYSTVVLLSRFAYNILSGVLLKNKTFQINSGFVFEDKVSKILESKGFVLTDITRIDHKEFDLITIKNGKIYNFQCKNNLIDIAKVGFDYKKMAKLNNRLCRYYDKALLKEEKRESLILTKTGFADIQHFVISRYPVISRNSRFINFNRLESWVEPS